MSSLEKDGNMLKNSFITFLGGFIPSLIVYYIFGFEISLIFAICLAISFLEAAILDVHNTIANKK